jgi:hypothetical protein
MLIGNPTLPIQFTPLLIAEMGEEQFNQYLFWHSGDLYAQMRTST